MKQLKRQAEVDMAERLRKRARSVEPERLPTGAESVARELDELNASHQRLLDLLYERLRRIAAANPGDIVTLVSELFRLLGWIFVVLVSEFFLGPRGKICPIGTLQRIGTNEISDNLPEEMIAQKGKLECAVYFFTICLLDH